MPPVTAGGIELKGYIAMPTYQYKCDACGHEFEEFQKMSDHPIDTCPKCGDTGRVRRLISGGAGILFKGSGFYTTDYRSESYKKAAQSESTGVTAAKTEKAESPKSS